MRFLSLLFAIMLFSFTQPEKKSITLVVPGTSSVRTKFGAERLAQALRDAGYTVISSTSPKISKQDVAIFVGEWNDPLVADITRKNDITFGQCPGKEGFAAKSVKNLIIIRGADASGCLYGCLELAARIKQQGSLPVDLTITDQPEMVLRGACIGLQKTGYLPGRDVYEYPYTPENFPWFYDKGLWIRYLDMLAENRMNALYLWNGHPFASLVRLKDYPYAVEVDDATFSKNEEIFAFLTEEANKRGIFVIQMFYNIIVSKPFAEKNGLKTQDRNRPIIPIIADYTRKSIAAFIEKYPNVGLMVCLGEAINTEEDDVQWFTGTIIPGVRDGLKALGRTDEPPIVLRAHDTNAQLVLKYALPLYKNLYTEAKYNGESLTTYEPGGPWGKIHKDLSSLGSVHIDNVHIMANLEPFRYGSPDFIQKSVNAMHNAHGANGLHLYPQASYWDWPYTADNTSPRLLQIDRDRIWYQAWSRYAWNCHRDRNDEITYWNNELSWYYGCGKYGHNIREAYEQAGEIAPKLLRRFGITDGNRQTLLLGMFMSQLVNPYKWRVYNDFYASNGPKGEILIDYAEKEWKKQPHTGETPPQIIDEVVKHGNLAVQSIDSAAPFVTNNNPEFLRLKGDIYCYQAFARFFSEKVKAAMFVLRYKYSQDVKDLDEAATHLKKSVGYYQQLVDLTKGSYLYANSMQTQQRRIPIGGDNGKNKTWAELLPHYEEELANFNKNVSLLKVSGNSPDITKKNAPFSPVQVKLLDKDISFFPVEKGQKVYRDTSFIIRDIAPELKDMQGLRLSIGEQLEQGTTIHFECSKPVKVLVGYFNGHSKKILLPQNLETNANANDRGQSEIRLANAMDIPGLYPVNIYTFSFDAGKNTLDLGKGMVMVLGFMDASQHILMRDAGLGVTDQGNGVDWLFY
jgi:hypothetical protein